MARCGFNSETPAAVSKRMTDVIMSFPSAAMGGVQWKVLIGKYNERHSTSLDIADLGHSSALAAATALLWDVLRVVDAKDVDNPVLAVEDGVAMLGQPGAPATWPSIYHSLCEIVKENGPKQEEAHEEMSSSILVSQLKPLLQRRWHSDFDECSLSYVSAQGKPVKVKKMKHLLLALLEWRDERLVCPAAGRSTELDEVLKPQLALVPSKTHNDLLLRCVWSTSSSQATCNGVQSAPSTDTESTAASTTGSTDLMNEIEMLRAENASLRSKNVALEQQVHEDVLPNGAFDIPAGLQTVDPMLDVWGDPSEPPPFEYCGSRCAATPGSTAVPSDIGFSPGDGTPLANSHSHSVGATPTMWVWDGNSGQICSMMPMWYVMGDRGLHDVPSGVVQQAVTSFEHHKVLPSFFTMGARES